MRLLNVWTFQLEEFMPYEIPEYAILSHRWGRPSEEVSYSDMIQGQAESKPAYFKIQNSCQQAASEQLNYIWIDTCCIDKTNNVEVSEAINSMFSWYQRSIVCYAYLSDVPSDIDVERDATSFTQSSWFTRGWTLQELIAPRRLIFFSDKWREIGNKTLLAQHVSEATAIDRDYLNNSRSLEDTSIAQRMSWASKRITSRPEDLAYCLLGIFSVSLDLRYGEGDRAFIRLQEEIMSRSDDESIFAWTDPKAPTNLEHGLLADTPSQFAESYDIIPAQRRGSEPFSMTNKGLSIHLQLSHFPHSDFLYYARLGCMRSGSSPREHGIMIVLTTRSGLAPTEPDRFDNQFRRIWINFTPEFDNFNCNQDYADTRRVFIPQSAPKLLKPVRPPLPGEIFFLRHISQPWDDGQMSLSLRVPSARLGPGTILPLELQNSLSNGGFKLLLAKNMVCATIKHSSSRTHLVRIGRMHNALLGFETAPFRYKKQMANPLTPGTWSQVEMRSRRTVSVTVKVTRVTLQAPEPLHDFQVVCYAIDLECIECPPAANTDEELNMVYKRRRKIPKTTPDSPRLRCPSCEDLVPASYLGGNIRDLEVVS